ncbi:MAG: 23S rRNA pseudouridine(2605) synthase RluB [Thiohalospira sp.]
MSEKLQKVLARAGYGSRRELEQWIADGRVRVNGRTATLGDRAGPEDKVQVDGKAVRLAEAPRIRVLAYYKPEGEVVSRRDPEGRPSVFDRLPRLPGGRWVAVGRLDLNSQGLLLFTNEGELASALMHPSSEIEREYAVRIFGAVPPATLNELTRGVELEDGPARFDSVTDAGGEGRNHWYRVVLREGRNREVRRLWEAVGHPVSRLLRVRYGPVQLPRWLQRGRWEELTPEAVAELLTAAGLGDRTDRAHPPKKTRARGKAGTGGKRKKGGQWRR